MFTTKGLVSLALMVALGGGGAAAYGETAGSAQVSGTGAVTQSGAVSQVQSTVNVTASAQAALDVASADYAQASSIMANAAQASWGQASALVDSGSAALLDASVALQVAAKADAEQVGTIFNSFAQETVSLEASFAATASAHVTDVQADVADLLQATSAELDTAQLVAGSDTDTAVSALFEARAELEAMQAPDAPDPAVDASPGVDTAGIQGSGDSGVTTPAPAGGTASANGDTAASVAGVSPLPSLCDTVGSIAASASCTGDVSAPTGIEAGVQASVGGSLSTI